MTNPIKRVLVLGDGVAAATAALAVARAFRGLGVAVDWLDRGMPPEPNAALAAPPDIKRLHRLLGIGEGALVRRTGATLRLGDRFVGWGGAGSDCVIAQGDAGAAFAELPFVQHWSRARRAGMAVALEEFCLAAAAAKHGRVRTEAGRPAMDHGYHLDAASYAALLAEKAEAAGVRRRRDAAPGVAVADGRIAGVTLSGGERIEADLYVDADGALIDAVDPGRPPADGDPCDRALWASAPPLSPLPPIGGVIAHAAGHVVSIPLRDRTAIRIGWASAHLDEAAAHGLATRMGATVIGAARETASGVRARPWVGNCVAIGPAAGMPQALDAAPMLALQLGVGQLVLLWPIDRDAMPEAAPYNREVTGHRARIDEFSALHFALSARHGEPFWDAARARPTGAVLAGKIALFATRGKFAHADHEAIVEDGWMMAMAGHGIVPRSSDPQGAHVEDQPLMIECQRQLRDVAQAVRAMETHEAALARLGRAPA